MIKVQFLNSADCELDARTVKSEDEIKAAVIDILDEADHLSEGDKIVVGYAD